MNLSEPIYKVFLIHYNLLIISVDRYVYGRELRY